MKTISILGCGWLGAPLGKTLAREGWRIKGATTTEEKIAALKKENIIPYLLRSDPEIKGSQVKDFFKSDVLVMTLPFRRDFEDPTFYKEQIQEIVCEIESSPVKFVIFTGSTSIYPLKNEMVFEDERIHPQTLRAEVLYQIEQMLFSNTHFSATVLRLAGLYGPGREIGKLFHLRGNLAGADHPLNLIHRDDAVEVIKRIIEKDLRGEIFNVCSDEHPCRRDLYTQAAVKRGLPQPVFERGKSGSFKIVNNEKLKNHFGYRFIHPDPMKDL